MKLTGTDGNLLPSLFVDPDVNTYSSTKRARRPWARYLMLALLIVPIVEVYVILQVGQAIGGWATFALLLLWSGIGAWLVKREAGRSFGALRQAFATGRMPTRELTDAALVLVGGTLLLAPGFITDFLGLFFIFPLTRPITRKLLEKSVEAKLFGGRSRFSMVNLATGAFTGAGRGSHAQDASSASQRLRTEDVYGTTPYPYPQSSSTRRGGDDIIDGEIIT